jgi:Cu(I)/Ag(I) efflux system membrane fusion protein/cobalt-zinc-cadmium efflux system membrane fusion protein
MTSSGLRLRTFVVSAAVAIAVAAGGWAFRDTLARLPWVGHLIPGQAAKAADEFVCPMHPEVRSPTPAKCPKCGMDLVRESELATASTDHGDHPESPPGGTDATPRAPVQLDLRRQQLIGVRLAAVEPATLDRTIRAVGTVAFDETRLTDVNVRLEGYVRDLRVDATGVFVARGAPLFTLYSPDLLATEQEYLLARRTRERASPAGGPDEAGYVDRLASAARQRLQVWNLPDNEVEHLERTGVARGLVTFPSPAAGFVIQKNVVEGQRVMAGETLYRLADLSTVWVEADVYERDLAAVRPGLAATVGVDAFPGETFAARVLLVAPSLDASTRAARVRLAIVNRAARLRPGMFANVELAAARARGLTVPADAVVDSGTRQFVFVSQGDGFFEPRRVEIGARTGGLVGITRGLEEGEQVASGATFFIDSESQLRAAMEGFEGSPDLSAPQGSAAAFDITFRTDPDPPRNGDTMFVVVVKDAEGKAVPDLQVAVRLFMAPMPSMNMPAMRTDVTLVGAGDGEYHGHGNISMAGKWDVTVTASRNGQRVASRMLGIVAK